MKILFLNHNPVGFGTYFRCLNLGKQLGLKDYEVELVCASEKDFDLRVRKKVISKNLKLITLPRIKLHQYYTGQTLRSFIGSFEVLKRKYDILHSFAVAQPPTAIPTYFAKLKTKNIFIDWDDLWTGGFASYHPYPVRKTLEFFERKTPKIAKGLTFVSDLLGEKIKEFNFDKPSIKIPNGCNFSLTKRISKSSARKKLSIDKSEKVIVSLGHTYFKSMFFLLKAFEKVVNKFSEAKLYLVGGVKIPEEYKGIYNKLRNNIVLTGEVPYNTVLEYLFASDVLALPMEDSSIERARWPIRLGDYLIAGRPIVSNSVGEVKNVLEKGKCGLTCASDDYENFGGNILKLFNNKETAKKIGFNCAKTAKEYDWSRITDKLIRFYEGLI